MGELDWSMGDFGWSECFATTSRHKQQIRPGVSTNKFSVRLIFPQTGAEVPNLENSSRFKAGQVAPRSGVYRVHHYAHRMPHLVIVLAGIVFPKCRRCGEKVRFVPMVASERIEKDIDFVDEFAA